MYNFVPLLLVKRLIALAFVGLFLSATPFVNELVKFPILISHYLEHREKDNFSFVDFLKMHYIEKTVVDSDYEKDISLPFKTITNVGLGFFFYVNHSINLKFALKKVLLSNQPPSYLALDYLSNYYISIWNPPRTA